MSLRLSSPSHPSIDTLRAFAAGSCDAPTHQRIRRHVAECESCRERIVGMIDLHALPARPGGTARLRDDALSRILAGRTEGRRVLLPHGDAVPAIRTPRRTSTYAAAAAVLLIGIATVVVSSNELTASDVSGELRFSPALPTAGDSVRVEYRGTRFGRDDQLRLRALLRTDHDEEPDWAARYGTVAVLRRDPDGVYRGAFTFGDSVVYGAFAVEDTAGADVDTRGGRLWDLLVRDARGRPAFAAMREQMRFHYGREQQVSLRTARELTQVHPENPESWQVRLWYEWTLAGPSGRDSLHARYRPQFVAMHRTLQDSVALSPRAMEVMWLYASQLDEDSATSFWSRRLVADHPRSMEGARQRYFALPKATSAAARDSLLESLWNEVAPESAEDLTFHGFMIARGTANAAGLRRWGVRMERFGAPWYNSTFVGFNMARTPGLEAEGAERLRAHLREFADISDVHRIVGETVEEHRQRINGMRASALVALGHALDAMGRADAALDTLDVATTLGWDPAAYLKIADLQLRRGDAAAATRAAAYAYADGSMREEAIALRRRAAWGSDSTWAALVSEGRAVQQRQLLAGSIDQPLRALVRIKDTEGREHELADVIRGAPTVVAFWSRYCVGSVEQLPELQRAVEELARQGARLVAITAEPPSPELTTWLKEKGYTFDVYHDHRNEAAMVLEPWGTPDNLVLDANGRLRFRRVGTKDVVGRVEVLR